VTGGVPKDEAEKRELLAGLRRQIRVLETELGAVADVETPLDSTDPRTLTAREQQLTEAERIAQVGSWAMHLATSSVHWSDQMYRIFGVDPDNHGDLVTLFFERIHPDDRPRIKAAHTRMGSVGSFPPSEFRLVRPDGTMRLVRAQGSGVLDALGAPVRFVGTIHDVTELRQAERDRLRDDEMLRAAEALAGVGSYRWIPTTGEVIWSNQFRAILGESADTRPTTEAFLSRLHPEDRARLEASIGQALTTGKTDSLGVRLIRDDGTVRQLILEGRFIEGGEMLGSVLDVTDVRQLESDLFQAQKLEALGRLAGGIAHDFNNILAVLKLGIESRNGGASLVSELSTAIDRGAGLTRQLLAFSRKNLLEPRPVDVADLLRQSVTLVDRLLGDAVSARLALGSEALTVNADPTQLQHTLINLMVNARDAMPSGGTIWLTAKGREFSMSPVGVKPPLTPGKYVEIEVRDEGTGIDAAVLPHIFEPFFTTKPVGQGTGLGLASVYGTVSQSGGGLGVRSQAGSGSSFQIYLPRTDIAPERVAAGGARAVRPGKGERILVLDDLPAIRHVLSIILESAGYEPVLHEDLHALVADAAGIAASCQAVVTDLDMPGFTGPDIARILWRYNPSLPVLFMSGHPVLELPSSGLAPTAFLGKPFSADDALEQLTALLGKRLALH
jgi:two-component system cell cycle sensor histidine kinase/response regulator CckA